MWTTLAVPAGAKPLINAPACRSSRMATTGHVPVDLVAIIASPIFNKELLARIVAKHTRCRSVLIDLLLSCFVGHPDLEATRRSRRSSRSRMRRLMLAGRRSAERPGFAVSEISSPRLRRREDAGSPSTAFTSRQASANVSSRDLPFPLSAGTPVCSFWLGGPRSRRGHESGHLRLAVFDQGPNFAKIRFEQV